MKKEIPRYTIATITTKDINLKHRRDEIKRYGHTDEYIYQRGLEVIAMENLTQNNMA